MIKVFGNNMLRRISAVEKTYTNTVMEKNTQ
jgi:hypothetical protein